jgi:hypothetical protein
MKTVGSGTGKLDSLYLASWLISSSCLLMVMVSLWQIKSIQPNHARVSLIRMRLIYKNIFNCIVRIETTCSQSRTQNLGRIKLTTVLLAICYLCPFLFQTTVGR